MEDHVHMFVSIPPKYAVAQVIGFMKGKSAIHIARTFGGRKQNFTGQHFWARGYYVSTVGGDEATIRQYIQTQEEEDRRLDQLAMFASVSHLQVAPIVSNRFERFTSFKPPALPVVADTRLGIRATYSVKTNRIDSIAT